MSKKLFAFFLSFAMIMATAVLPEAVSPAAAPTVHAADEDIRAWYSAEKDGGTVQYVEKGTTAYVNYEYQGDETAYNIQVEVSEAGSLILSRQYMNVSRNSVTVPFDKEGVYTLSVMVTDGENITASTTETLECVTGLPVIDTQPASITSDVGETVTFTVSSSTPGVSYQWYMANTLMSGGHAISGASTDRLTISAENVTDSLNGTFYYCQVTANGYTINSDYAALTINSTTTTPTPGSSADPTKEPGEETQTPVVTDMPSNTPDISEETKVPAITDIPGKTNIPDETDPPAETNIPTQTPVITDLPSAMPDIPETPGITDKPSRTDIPGETATPPVGQHTDGPVPTKIPETKCKAKAVYSIAGNKIKVSWNACGTSYKVYRSTKKKSGYSFRKNVKSTFYTDAKVSHGKTYYYKIQPVKLGTKIKASLVHAKVNIKPVLKKYSVKKKGRSIKVIWEYNRADYVIVYVNTGNGWSKLGKVSGKKSHCSIGVPGGYSRVKVRIRAYNTEKKKKYYSKYTKTKTVKI